MIVSMLEYSLLEMDRKGLKSTHTYRVLAELWEKETGRTWIGRGPASENSSDVEKENTA